jgi:hypothetical protein
MRCTWNQFYGSWGGGSPRKVKTAVIHPIPACTVARTSGGADNGTGAREWGSYGIFWGKKAV